MAGKDYSAGQFRLPDSLEEARDNFMYNVRNARSGLGSLARTAASKLSAKVPDEPRPEYSYLGNTGIRARISDDPNDPLSYQSQLKDLRNYNGIPAWRADPKRPGELETLPIGWSESQRRVDRNYSLDRDELRIRAEALRDAKELGFKYPDDITSPEFLAALALREGRGDYGSNAWGDEKLTNKTAKRIFNTLLERGTDHTAASFAALMYEKAQDAKRLNKPFTLLWNGAGTFKEEDGTVGGGEYYARNFDLFQQAARHRKNAPLVNFIRGALTPDPVRKASGGMVENTTHYPKMI